MFGVPGRLRHQKHLLQLEFQLGRIFGKTPELEITQDSSVYQQELKAAPHAFLNSRGSSLHPLDFQVLFLVLFVDIKKVVVFFILLTSFGTSRTKKNQKQKLLNLVFESVSHTGTIVQHLPVDA